MELAEAFAKFVVRTEFKDMDESVIEYVKELYDICTFRHLVK